MRENIKLAAFQPEGLSLEWPWLTFLLSSFSFFLCYLSSLLPHCWMSLFTVSSWECLFPLIIQARVPFYVQPWFRRVHSRFPGDSVFIFFIFYFCLFRDTPSAYGGSQAGGLTQAIAAGLHHSHSNTRSEPHLQATQPQGNARSSIHWARPGIQPVSSWILVTFVSPEPWWELWDWVFDFKS